MFNRCIKCFLICINKMCLYLIIGIHVHRHAQCTFILINITHTHTHIASVMPDAMDSTTSKRYEGKIPWVQRSQPAVRRQQCRILDDQKNAAMVADNVECEKTSLFANWKEVIVMNLLTIAAHSHLFFKI